MKVQNFVGKFVIMSEKMRKKYIGKHITRKKACIMYIMQILDNGLPVSSVQYGHNAFIT